MPTMAGSRAARNQSRSASIESDDISNAAPESAAITTTPLVRRDTVQSEHRQPAALLNKDIGHYNPDVIEK
jgi:hypothetical protein